MSPKSPIHQFDLDFSSVRKIPADPKVRLDYFCKFKDLIQEYAVKRGKAVDKTRRQYSGPIDVALDNAVGKVRKKWVKKVDRLLDDDQMTRFPAFLEQLDIKLAEQTATDEEVNPADAWEFN